MSCNLRSIYLFYFFWIPGSSSRPPLGWLELYAWWPKKSATDEVHHALGHVGKKKKIQFVLPTCRTVRGYLRTHSGVNRIRPLKLTWRIKFSPIERKIIFQTKTIFQGAPATHHISACTYDPTRDVPKYCTCREIQSPRVHTTLLTDAYSACTCDPRFRVYLRPPDLC